MSVLRSALGWGRRTAEARMTETVRIGMWVDGHDPETGEAVGSLGVERYSGRARVAYPSYAVAEMSPRSQPLSQQDVVVSIPVGSAIVHEGDVIEVTSSAVDPNVVGRRFTVAGQPLAGQVTAYRIPVIEQT